MSTHRITGRPSPHGRRQRRLGRARLLAIVTLSTLIAAISTPIMAAPASRAADPVRASDFDNATFIDANHIRMFVTNTGSFAWDKATGNAGLEFPKGSGKTCVFAAGPWLGARVAGQTRVAVSEYSDEYGPGAMIGTAPDYPIKPEYKVYKLYRTYSSATARDAALADYQAGALPHGAPAVTVLPDGSLGILGDQMLWAVYNDADPAFHTNRAGSTAPLGVEVQQTTFAFNRTGALGNAVFARFRIINDGGNTLDSMVVSLWSDPDVGGAGDDLVGCDSTADRGYAYNGAGSDFVYGAGVPAVGYDLLTGPLVASARLPMTSFARYSNGTDPVNSSETYNNMLGLNPDGTPVVDPVSGKTTRYAVNGDPVLGTGWLDMNPSDRRLLLSSGPFTMSPGDTQDVTFAIVIGQSTDPLSSISLMRTYDDQVKFAFDQGVSLGVAGERKPAARLALSGPYPNPVRSEITLEIACARAGAAHLEVFDVGGRRVLDGNFGTLGPGLHPIRLDMRARKPGLYLVRVRQNEEAAAVRAVVMR